MRTCAELFGRYWNTLKNLTRRQKYTSVFLVLSLVVGIFLVPDQASATLGEDIISVATQFWLWLASLGIQLAIFFLKFFILLAGYNGYINADIVKFGWNIVRDVANMFFIVILLVIAFGTILGLEQYEWKKSLPKLVFAAIFVNFSNVICQLLIDVSQVFTITFLNAVAGTAGGNLIAMMKFDYVFELSKSDPGGDIRGELFIGALMAMIFCFMAAAAIGSYVIVMLYRVVTLWCLIILSPLAFLFSILPSTKSYSDEFWKEFTNHVIAAPVMVFFLWLAFATFGAGDIVKDNLQAHNSLVGYNLEGLGADSDAVGNQIGGKVSNSEATTWINLANFIVAIAFLFIGLERVQKLGVRGGDYLQRAAGFAKNVLTIAAGVSLAQRGLDKGKGIVGSTVGSTVGFALNKAPIIGGDSLRRKGRALKSLAQIAGNRLNIKREDLRQKLEKKSPRLGNLAASMLLLNSSARKEKMAKNWESAAESVFKEWDERVGTSKTASGKAKLTQGVRLEIAEHLSAQKKRVKFAEERETLLQANGHDNPYHKMEQEQAKASAQADIVEGKLEAQEQRLKAEYKSFIAGAAPIPQVDPSLTGKAKEEAEKERKVLLEQRDGKNGKPGYEARTKQEAEALAYYEEAQKKVTRGTEMDNAVARDKVLATRGEAPRYVRALKQKHRKDDDELRSSGSYDSTQASIRDVLSRLQNAPQGSVEKKQLGMELASLMSFAQSRGMIFGGGSMNTVNSQFGGQVKGVAADDILAAQARTLSPFVGRAVEATQDGVKKAFEDLQQTIGDPQEFFAFMSNLKDSSEAQANEGNISQAGLFTEDKIDGKSVIRLTNSQVQSDREFIDNKRGFSLSRVRFNTSSSMRGAVDTVRGADGKEILRAATQKAQENIVSIFSSVTKESANTIDKGLITDWNDIIKNTAAGDLKKLLVELKQKGDVEGLRTMFRRTNLRGSAVMQQFQTELSDLLDAPPPPGAGAPTP